MCATMCSHYGRLSSSSAVDASQPNAKCATPFDSQAQYSEGNLSSISCAISTTPLLVSINNGLEGVSCPVFSSVDGRTFSLFLTSTPPPPPSPSLPLPPCPSPLCSSSSLVKGIDINLCRLRIDRLQPVALVLFYKLLGKFQCRVILVLFFPDSLHH
ncbi:hypothetical protein OIU77_007360 [Salix suchowensis]|uniref:Uncharacterized protein n=1 Tax=Salix suchowensis TaxID=1278906 RepID=A0ABQ9AH11_9ROSI|nr:hypothetical protein OIU77_007360 [Salix suchowensis]